MKKQISILGCGWLGKPLAINLMQQGHKIKGSTTSESKLVDFQEIGILPFLINLDSLKENISAFLNSEILIVALPSKNIDGFKNLIGFIEKSPLKKVIFISSTSVYANSNEMVTEQTDIPPSALATIETIFKNSSHFKTTIIRFSGLFGYNRKPGKFFSKGKKIPNPEGFVNMIHQDDCIQLIEKIIQKNAWNEVFNGCSDSHPTRREFYSKATLDIGLELPDFEYITENRQKIISNKKSKELLNFQYKYGDLLQLDYGIV